jgi:hypothetical protein
MSDEVKNTVFSIPEKPVDGFTIRYWHLSFSDVWCYIREKKATYHANTPWANYSPNSGGGADLVDDWMVSEKSENGHWSDTGRWCGWDKVGWTKEHMTNCFATREEAIAEAKIRYNEAIDRAYKHIEEMEQLRDQFDVKVKA